MIGTFMEDGGTEFLDGQMNMISDLWGFIFLFSKYSRKWSLCNNWQEDYYVSVLFTGNTTQLLTEYLLNNSNDKLGVN